jgi:hypothetical protein
MSLTSKQQNTASAVGIVPRSVQIDFEKEEKKIQEYENINKKFHRDMKIYSEKLESLLKADSKLLSNMVNYSNIVSDFLHTNESNNICESVNQTFKEIQSNHAKKVEQIRHSCQCHVIEPMKNLSLIFPKIYQAIKKREQSLKDLLKQQKQLERLQEKKEHTGANLARINELEQTIKMLKYQFNNENKLLMAELPKFYMSRVNYIRPCVNCTINNQLEFYEHYKKFYDEILNNLSRMEHFKIDEEEHETDESGQSARCSSTSLKKNYENTSSADCDDQQMNEMNNVVQQCLANIKSLSIVAAD